MTQAPDASFADGAPLDRRRVRLRAETADDLAVLSALMQDAVGKTSEVAWLKRRGVFALVVSRFRWEDVDAAAAEGRAFERARCGLHFECVREVRFKGFDVGKGQQAFELLSLGFEPRGEDGAGRVTIECAGGAAFALDVETLDARMADMGEVWETKAMPRHAEADDEA